MLTYSYISVDDSLHTIDEGQKLVDENSTQAPDAAIYVLQGYSSLLRQLKLPLDERGRRRAANRAEWFTQVDKPLEIHDIISA